MGRTLIEGKAVQVRDVLADPEYMYLDHPKKPALEPFSAFRAGRQTHRGCAAGAYHSEAVH
jgi:hypothetical protein